MPDLLSRLPDMSDDALATLRGNAERLSRDGDEKQRAAAAEMLPAVLKEIAGRAEVKAAVKAEARRKKTQARKSA